MQVKLTMSMTMSHNNDMLSIIPTLCARFVVSVHRMLITENRPVDPDNIQGESPTYTCIIGHEDKI